MLSMHECSVCGLLFLGGDACPSCGSLGNQELDIQGNGKEVIEQRGGIPGMSELNTAMISVVGEEGLLDEDEVEEPTGTSLPFTVGGGASEEISSLPFGVGSSSASLSSTESNHEKEESPTIESEISAAPDVELLQRQSDNSATESKEPEQWNDVGDDSWGVGENQDLPEQNKEQIPENFS